MKEKIKKVLLLFVVNILAVFCLGSNVLAEENIKVDMKVGIGDGNYKMSYWTPFNFKIENKLKDINGQLQIELINEKDELNAYSKEVNLPLNSTKNITISAPVLNWSGKVNVKILDGKKTVYEKEIPMKMGARSGEIFMGVLSDEQDSLNYLAAIKSISIGSNGAITKYIKLSEKDIMDFHREMDTLDIIVMNNFDSSKLTPEQYDILKEWVDRGGVLLVGTGSSYNKTLAVFKDDFITGTIGSVNKVNTNLANNTLPQYYIKESKSLAINSLDLNFKEGKAILKEGNKPLVWNMEKGKGLVAITSFDMGEEPITSWSFKEQFMTKFIELSMKSSQMGKMYYPDGGMRRDIRGSYAFKNAVSNIVELPLPKISNILIILGIYLVLVAPVAYLVLKKKDKREYIWIVTPVLAIVFVFVIYLSGMGTRISNNVANVMNIITMDEKGNSYLDSYASVFSPKKSNIKVEAGKGMSLCNSLQEFNNDPYNASNYVKRDRKVQCKVEEGTNNYVQFYDTPVFSSNLLELNYKNPKMGKVDSDISYYNGKFIGKIKNNTGMDLTDCYIITRSNYLKLGKIKAGEEKTLNTTGGYYGELYSFVENEFSIPDRYAPKSQKKAAPISKDEARRRMQKRDMLFGYFEMQQMTVNEPIFIAMSNKGFSKDLIVNGKDVKKYEKSLIISPIKLKFGRGKNVEYPYGYFKAQWINMNGGYDERQKKFYGTGMFEMEFTIDENIDMEEINVKYKLDYLKGTNEIAKQYIWNVKDQKWQEGDFREFNISKKDFSKYLTADKKIKIKFEMLQDGVNGELPQISVKGSVK